MPVVTVSQLNRFIRLTLEGEPKLRGLVVRGEISNCSARSLNGHLYFSLKDEESVLRCVMFSSRARGLRFLPEDGMRVMASGDVTVYERGGQYQLNVYDLAPDGAGALYLQFEERKRKLAALGLFDQARKRPLPPFPKRIGIVAAAGSAALADILSITARRWPLCEITVAPSLVQGKDAPASLIAALALLGREPAPDLIVLARGGGSAEDLWAFNDEKLAYAICRCPVPVVSAVGHEVDYTIADFAADLRAPTPSAAAELITPDISEHRAGLAALGERMNQAYLRRIGLERQRFSQLRGRPCLASPRAPFLLRREGLKRLSERLDAAAGRSLDRERSRLRLLGEKLEALSPLRVLERGYAVVLSNGRALTSAENAAAGDRLHICVRQGELDAVVVKEEEHDL